MRPNQEDEREEYRGGPPGEGHRDAPAGDRGQDQGPPRQSRYQSPPPRGPPTGSPPQSGSPPTRIDRAMQAQGGPPRGGEQGQTPPPQGEPRQSPPVQGGRPTGPPGGPAGGGQQTGRGGPAGQEQRAGQAGMGQPGVQEPGGRSGAPGTAPAGQPPGQPAPAGRGLAPIGVDELLTEEVVTAERDTPIATVVAEMAERNVGSVVIVEDDAPVGILTDRGIALALETMPDVAEREAGELVADELVTGSTEMTAVDALRRLSEEGIRRLPIVDEDGALAGIVTVDDVIVTFSEELRNVADVVRSQSPRP